ERQPPSRHLDHYDRDRTRALCADGADRRADHDIRTRHSRSDRNLRRFHHLAFDPYSGRLGRGLPRRRAPQGRAGADDLMAIRVTLDRILLERRMSLTDLSEKVGVTLANLSILKTGKAKAIRFSTLNALCRVLECQPGELLAYEPSEEDAMHEAADQAAD